MASPGSKARLFVALDLPEGAREELVAWRERAFGGRDELRLVAPEALHVTLVFLGHLDEAVVPRVAALIQPPAVAAPLLEATRVRPVPARHPRLFALELGDEGGRSAVIQSAVAEALAIAGFYEPETRPFWPHVTLARVRKGARIRSLEPPPPPPGAWRAPAVTLYRSRLSRTGARYEALGSIQLPI